MCAWCARAWRLLLRMGCWQQPCGMHPAEVVMIPFHNFTAEFAKGGACMRLHAAFAAATCRR